MEEVAAASGKGLRWYQLYWPNDDELCVSFFSVPARPATPTS